MEVNVAVAGGLVCERVLRGCDCETAQQAGCIRTWETSRFAFGRSLAQNAGFEDLSQFLKAVSHATLVLGNQEDIKANLDAAPGAFSQTAQYQSLGKRRT